MQPATHIENRRLLIIDDNPAIHEDFRKILVPDDVPANAHGIEADEAAIFGDAPAATAASGVVFEVDSASQGQEGLDLIRRAQEEQRPYTMAFVDVRMPPGWDGIETTRQIWAICPDLQIVICTAYSDYSWSEMQEQIKPRDRLLILKKPFDTVEVLQLAHALTEKWRLQQEFKCLMSDLEARVQLRTRELESSMEEAVRSREKERLSCESLRHEMAERGRLEQCFREQAALLDKTTDAIVVSDLEHRITYWNKGAEKIYGWSAKEVIGQRAPALLYREITPFETAVASIVKRGAGMVRQLLTFASGLEGKQLAVQVDHLLREIEKIANETFLKTVQVRSEIPADLWTVQGDPTQLHQVLLNLCVNARDAMPDGGTLKLSARNQTIDKHYVGLNGEVGPGPYIAIQVEDTGTGMPPEVIERIFEPFFTTKELGKGTGLGLSTSLGIIKSHHGFLHVESLPGAGTKFLEMLPAHTAGATVAEARAETELPRGRGELVLVVDDESDVRQVVQQILEAFGYWVLLAADGSEAVALYTSRKEEIAVVVTDMMMPVMDGPATIRALMRLNPQVRIIAASGLSTSSNAAKAAKEGVKQFIPKPYTTATLLQTVHAVLQG